MTPLALAGFVPFSTVDWPERHAAVLFCRGCPWSCAYCHNRHLQATQGPSFAEQVGPWLVSRMGRLDGVVFSGGEPLLQRGLAEVASQVRVMGFEVGLHTGGAYPERLAPLLPDLAWVGFDLKAPWEGYDAITGRPGSATRARRSLEMLVEAGIPLEIRTTVHAALTSPVNLLGLADLIAAYGLSSWVIQAFRSTGCTEPELLGRSSWESGHTEALQAIRRRHPGLSLTLRGEHLPALSA